MTAVSAKSLVAVTPRPESAAGLLRTVAVHNNLPRDAAHVKIFTRTARLTLTRFHDA